MDKKSRYSAQVQLQYLMHKMKLNPTTLHAELDAYFDDKWDKKLTKSGKITEVKLKDGKVAKPVKAKPVKKAKVVKPAKPKYDPTHKPKVIVKKRRVIDPLQTRKFS